MEAPIMLRLFLTLAVLPWFVALALRLRDAREYLWFAVAFYALSLAVVATAIERGLDVQMMDTVQHGLYAVAGVSAAAAALLLRRNVLARRRRT